MEYPLVKAKDRKVTTASDCRVDNIVTCPNCGRQYWAGAVSDFPPRQERYCYCCGSWYMPPAHGLGRLDSVAIENGRGR